MPPYFVGLDLGQAHDFSALVVIEQVPVAPAGPLYEARLLHRWPLQTPYPVIVRQTDATLSRPPLVHQSILLVDHTGVGRPIVDTIRQQGLELQAVSLHGGDNVSHIGSNWRVPKRDLVGAVQLLLQHDRLHIAAGLAFTATLTAELLNFRVKIDPATAHDSYAAWRERDHDDLVLALALACWWGEKEQRSRVPHLDLRRGLAGLHKTSSFRSPGSVPRSWAGDYDV